MNKQASEPKKEGKKPINAALGFYDLVEMLAEVTVVVLLMFAFLIRLNVVEGQSMEKTLHQGEYLAVSDLFYTPEAGDIVVVHRIDAKPFYGDPIVKRVIATAGQTVDIDFDTWTLTVDGEPVDESAYRYIDPDAVTVTCEYPLPITLGEHEVFVMGDNRNHSGDSRQIELGPIDERCIVGRAVVRLSPLSRFTVFKNPFAA